MNVIFPYLVSSKRTSQNIPNMHSSSRQYGDSTTHAHTHTSNQLFDRQLIFVRRRLHSLFMSPTCWCKSALKRWHTGVVVTDDAGAKEQPVQRDSRCTCSPHRMWQTFGSNKLFLGSLRCHISGWHSQPERVCCGGVSLLFNPAAWVWLAFDTWMPFFLSCQAPSSLRMTRWDVCPFLGLVEERTAEKLHCHPVANTDWHRIRPSVTLSMNTSLKSPEFNKILLLIFFEKKKKNSLHIH